MAQRLEIRDMQASDRPAVVRFMAALNDFEVTLSPDRAAGAEMAEGHVTFLLEEVSRRGGFTLIAEADAQVAGFLLAYVSTIDEGATHLRAQYRKTGEVSDLFVDPAFRRLGLAQTMIGEAERRFREMGLSRMEIHFLDANTPAERTYRAAGFVEHERIFIKPL